MEAEERAEHVIGGGDITIADLEEVTGTLRAAGRTALVGRLLTEVARRALYHDWRRAERAALAMTVLRDHQQFGYARRLLAEVRGSGTDSPTLRQQHALCTYKDLALPAAQRLDQALKILERGGPLRESTDAETLGIAGAIYKRRWEVDARTADLESALWCYQRGFEQEDHGERWYAGINAAFVADRLVALETDGFADEERAAQLRRKADEIRATIARELPAGTSTWADATLGEALFGLGRFDEAAQRLAAAARTEALWRQETTATQLAALAELRGYGEHPGATAALSALLRGRGAALHRATTGKVGLALSGGGYRASLYHLGVLARLAECNVLRRVEVLSCVSGGSIVGAHYYLKLRALLQKTPDDDISDQDYVDLVRQLIDEFLAGVRRNLRKKVMWKRSRSERAGELFEEYFYGPLRDESGPWRMPDLIIEPADARAGFTLRYENWMRAAKIPMLVLNATALNTGHAWQFTAAWMGEPPSVLDAKMDASHRLRRVYYRDAPPDVEDLREPTLGKAVAASACVPGLFPPVRIRGLYPGVDVELVDGGVHDNQGIASLLEQDCTVLLVSDASGQLRDSEEPKRWMLSVLTRSNDVLMKRVRGAQYGELIGRRRAGTLRGFMGVHLTKGLAAEPRDWVNCQEEWREEAESGGDEPYSGLDPAVQRRLAELRTDLDAFSDEEAYGLMAVGYLMAKSDLKEALPAAVAVLEGEWPFWDTLTAITEPGGGGRLADTLRWGHVRLLRKPRAKIERLAARFHRGATPG